MGLNYMGRYFDAPYARLSRGMLFSNIPEMLVPGSNPNPSVPIRTDLSAGALTSLCISGELMRSYLMRMGMFARDATKYAGVSIFNGALNTSVDTRVNAIPPVHTTPIATFENSYVPLKLDIAVAAGVTTLRKYANATLSDTRAVPAFVGNLTPYLETDSDSVTQVGGNSYLTRYRNIVVCKSNNLIIIGLPPYGSVKLSVNGAALVTINLDGNGDVVWDFGGVAFPCSLKCFVYDGANGTGKVVGVFTASDASGGDVFGARRTTLPVVPFTPASISRLSLWLRPETLVGVDGAVVLSWPDSSGLGRDLAKNAAVAAPLLKTLAYNARSVVRFNGTGQLLAVQLAALRPANFMLAVAMQFAAGNPTPRGLLSIMANAVQGVNINNSGGANAESVLTGDNVSGVGYPTTFGALNTMHIVFIEVNGLTGRVRIYLNGAAAPTVDAVRGVIWSTDTPDFSLGTYYCGLNGAAPALYAAGDIGEVVMYDKILRDADRIALASYLTTRWT